MGDQILIFCADRMWMVPSRASINRLGCSERELETIGRASRAQCLTGNGQKPSGGLRKTHLSTNLRANLLSDTVNLRNTAYATLKNSFLRLSPLSQSLAMSTLARVFCISVTLFFFSKVVVSRLAKLGTHNKILRIVLPSGQRSCASPGT